MKKNEQTGLRVHSYPRKLNAVIETEDKIGDRNTFVTKTKIITICFTRTRIFKLKKNKKLN